MVHVCVVSPPPTVSRPILKLLITRVWCPWWCGTICARNGTTLFRLAMSSYSSSMLWRIAIQTGHSQQLGIRRWRDCLILVKYFWGNVICLSWFVFIAVWVYTLVIVNDNCPLLSPAWWSFNGSFYTFVQFPIDLGSSMLSAHRNTYAASRLKAHILDFVYMLNGCC